MRLTCRYKTDFPKKLEFYDMEEGLFISVVFYLKPYLSVNYFNSYCLSHFDGSSSGLMNQFFAAISVVRQYRFMHTHGQCICISVFRNKKYTYNMLVQSYTYMIVHYISVV